MIRIRPGVIREIRHVFPDYIEAMAEVEGEEAKVIAYPQITGTIELGDEVLLNTTALSLNLGTGGYHYVMGNLVRKVKDDHGQGHIMKLRYTPAQVRCLAAEEGDSLVRDKIEMFDGLKGMPIIIGELHSMLPPAAAALKELSDDRLNVAYIMTDGAALPIAFSRLVRTLKEKELINGTITIGHAFGGDYEAVNIYSGLIVAQMVLKADVAIVSMGPGIVGTGTKYGFTGIEVANIIDAVNALGGTPIAIPRLSFADERERHIGVSHHTLTSLGEIAHTKALLPLPCEIDESRKASIEEMLKNSKIYEKHEVRWVCGAQSGIDRLVKDGVEVKTMGREINQDKEFFLGASSGGVLGVALSHNN